MKLRHANVINWTSLHSPLELVERHNNSLPLSPMRGGELPFRSGASLLDNYVGLRFRNPSGQTHHPRVLLNQTHLCGELRRK